MAVEGALAFPIELISKDEGFAVRLMDFAVVESDRAISNGCLAGTDAGEHIV